MQLTKGVLISVIQCNKSVCPSGSARTRWGSLHQRSARLRS